MNARLNPFKDVSRLEKELKRTELYEDILKQLKSESYDSSPIGHHFVTQYEQQLPGIITAVSGDHSFLNSDEESNRRVIMEAVSGGMALKAGLVAAVLMIIYKIIRVMTNNPAFKAGGGGGGRGTAPYVAQKQEQLVKAAENLQAAIKDAEAATQVVKANALTRDETSPQYAAAEKAASAIKVYQHSSTGGLEEKPNDKTTSDNPLEVIKNIDITAFGFGDLPSFMMVKDTEIFLHVLKKMNAVIKALNTYSPGKLADMVEAVSVKLSQPKDAAFMLSPAYNNMIDELTNRIGQSLGVNLKGSAGFDRDQFMNAVKSDYDEMIRTSYETALREDPNMMIRYETFVVEFVNPDGEFAKRSAIVADFNSSFNEFIGSHSELEDGGFYTNLQHYAAKLTEYKASIKQEAELDNKDEIIKRIDVLISLIQVYTKFLLAALCMFRKEVDKIDTFREANIDKMEKLAKALIDFVNKSREETT